MLKISQQEALDYHTQHPAGKLEVVPTNAMRTQRDLALAYSPGVAEPCLQIVARKDDVYKFTAKGNLVAVMYEWHARAGPGQSGTRSQPTTRGNCKQ